MNKRVPADACFAQLVKHDKLEVKTYIELL